jgi:hypothetical protein
MTGPDDFDGPPVLAYSFFLGFFVCVCVGVHSRLAMFVLVRA